MSGTESVRPSASSSVSASSEMTTLREEPGFQVPKNSCQLPSNVALIVLNNFLDEVELVVCKSRAALEPDRVELELGLRTGPFDVDARRFVPIAGVEEKPIRTASQDGRQNVMLSCSPHQGNR